MLPPKLHQGSLNYPFGGEIKECKCMVNLGNFPTSKVHCLGWLHRKMMIAFLSIQELHASPDHLVFPLTTLVTSSSQATGVRRLLEVATGDWWVKQHHYKEVIQDQANQCIVLKITQHFRSFGGYLYWNLKWAIFVGCFLDTWGTPRMPVTTRKTTFCDKQESLSSFMFYCHWFPQE